LDFVSEVASSSYQGIASAIPQALINQWPI
jgi:hypothetical protein